MKITDTRVIFAVMMFFAVIAFIDGLFVTDAASLAELTWWGTTALTIAMLPLVYWLGAFGIGLIKKAYSLFKK